MRALMCVRTISVQGQSGGWNAVWVAPVLTFCQRWMEGNVLLCSCSKKKKKPFPRYKVSKVELDLSLNFPSSAHSLSLPGLCLLSHWPDPTLIHSTFSQAPYPNFLRLRWIFNMAVLTLSNEKIPPSTEGNSICPKASHIPQKESISCFLSN